jgi:hypothetical protein
MTEEKFIKPKAISSEMMSTPTINDIGSTDKNFQSKGSSPKDD